MSMSSEVRAKLAKLKNIGDHAIINEYNIRRVSTIVCNYSTGSNLSFVTKQVGENNIVMCFGGKWWI